MQPGAAERLVADAFAVAGRLDICVNNAGMIAVGGTATDATLDDTTDEQWHDGLQRNLTTCFAVTRAAVIRMRGGGYGRIVNVASTSGPVQAFTGDVAFSKASSGHSGKVSASPGTVVLPPASWSPDVGGPPQAAITSPPAARIETTPRRARWRERRPGSRIVPRPWDTSGVDGRTVLGWSGIVILSGRVT